MRQIILALFAGAAPPALAHVHNVSMDIICTTTDNPPGLTLLPLLVLVAIGAVRAVLRQRK